MSDSISNSGRAPGMMMMNRPKTVAVLLLTISMLLGLVLFVRTTLNSNKYQSFQPGMPFEEVKRVYPQGELLKTKDAGLYEDFPHIIESRGAKEVDRVRNNFYHYSINDHKVILIFDINKKYTASKERKVN